MFVISHRHSHELFWADKPEFPVKVRYSLRIIFKNHLQEVGSISCSNQEFPWTESRCCKVYIASFQHNFWYAWFFESFELCQDLRLSSFQLSLEILCKQRNEIALCPLNRLNLYIRTIFDSLHALIILRMEIVLEADRQEILLTRRENFLHWGIFILSILKGTQSLKNHRLLFVEISSHVIHKLIGSRTPFFKCFDPRLLWQAFLNDLILRIIFRVLIELIEKLDRSFIKLTTVLFTKLIRNFVQLGH